jgi:hypothetical protein
MRICIGAPAFRRFGTGARRRASPFIAPRDGNHPDRRNTYSYAKDRRFRLPAVDRDQGARTALGVQP